MFHQLIDPVGHNLFLSFLVGFIPIVVVLVLLGIVRLPAWQAALAGLLVGLLVAVTVWSMPVGLAVRSMGLGATFALLPVMWIVWNAMWLYNVAVQTGKFELFRRWMVYNVPPDRRILVLVVGFSFGALMEGIAGFGTPVAIGSALLIGLGFAPLEALTLTLIFDTAPVAFGALGVPITTLGLVTSLPTAHLSAMVGRQLPLFAFMLPFYALIVLSGWRGLRSAWPAALVAGGSFAVTQFLVSNFVGPELPDVLAALVSLVCLIAFVQVWKPSDMDQYRAEIPGLGAAAVATSSSQASSQSFTPERPTPIGERNIPIPAPANSLAGGAPTRAESILGFLPWVMVSVVVIIWTYTKVSNQGLQHLTWPGLNNAVFRTIYHKAYPAPYDFAPLGTGTAILVAVLLTAAALRATPGQVGRALADTWIQLRFAILTVVLILALA